jgi:hypothetical protein
VATGRLDWRCDGAFAEFVVVKVGKTKENEVFVYATNALLWNNLDAYPFYTI